MSATALGSRRALRAAKPTKGDRQERELLDVATRLIVGGDALTASVSDIADAAGISRASFYFYFASKQALFATVVDETVSAFNAHIVRVAEVDHDDPADALRATIEAAGNLWWDHAPVMIASVMLGTTMPDVYERSKRNIAAVSAPTVDLLRRYGSVPEASHQETAEELVTSLILLCERTFYDLMRGNPSRAELDQVVARLSTIWIRSCGMTERA